MGRSKTGKERAGEEKVLARERMDRFTKTRAVRIARRY